MKGSEVLFRAADLLRTRGWGQNHAEDSKGRLCIAGAIRKAAGFHPRRGEGPDGTMPSLEPVRHIIEDVMGPNQVEFNNRDCKRAEDAIAAVEICACIAAADGL